MANNLTIECHYGIWEHISKNVSITIQIRAEKTHFKWPKNDYALLIVEIGQTREMLGFVQNGNCSSNSEVMHLPTAKKHTISGISDLVGSIHAKTPLVASKLGRSRIPNG